MKQNGHTKKLFIWIAAVGIGILCGCSRQPGEANAVDLAGVVSSQEEGLMEGVLVSARKEGSHITVTVVSDSQGRYAFPRGRLQPGSYRLKTRAVGYDLEDPGTVSIDGTSPASLDLKLSETKNLAAQLTNAEWFISNPDIKRVLLDEYKYGVNCIGCHPLSVVTTSKHDAKAWPAILNRMWNYSEASIYQPADKLVVPAKVSPPYVLKDRMALLGLPDTSELVIGQLSEFLSSINLSSSEDGEWPFELKTMPRLTGKSTRVIITEYDLPRRETQPHDAVAAPDGMVWYTDVGNGFLGRLNPQTGEIQEWPVPNKKTGLGSIGTFDLKLDKDGNPWVGISHQPGVAKFDKATEQFTIYSEMPGGMLALSPDGTVWGKDSANFKLKKMDPATGKVSVYPIPKPMRFYGIEADSQGNLYGASLQHATIGQFNGTTGEWTLHPTPTPGSGSRRGDIDPQDRFWFAEYYAGKIGMFDPKTNEITEWDIPPTPWSGPYDVVVDKNGEVWAGGEFTDNVFRVNPETGEVTTYPLPTLEMNVQRIEVDDSTTPVTIWVGQNHKARIARVEPLD